MHTQQRSGGWGGKATRLIGEVGLQMTVPLFNILGYMVFGRGRDECVGDPSNRLETRPEEKEQKLFCFLPFLAQKATRKGVGFQKNEDSTIEGSVQG